ncbi:MAG: hypothetical protein R3228_15925 [Halioglobus sp.]|nr:hypothetical protein [Halioglobus sp.]
MSFARIREIIATALLQEERSGSMRQALEARVPDLRRNLLLPEEDPAAALMAFITSYIRSVPAGLRLVTAVSKRQGFYEYAAPFLHMAQEYFLQPPANLPSNGPLEALLDEAFLAHRLLEEVNDHHVRQLKQPLLPVDMTEANIIVHHLLGDEFATRLEELVQHTASGLLGKEHVWEEARRATAHAGTALLSSERVAGEDRNVRLRLAS